MATWSSRRKSLYALVLIVVAVVLIGIPSFKLFYKAPSCFDNTQNGDEQGIDCGGSCTKLCSSAFLPIPSASWVRMTGSAPNTYNLAAYIVNPNPKAGAKAIPYSFAVLDKDGVKIGGATGKFDLPPGRNTLVFQNSIHLQNQQAARTTFDFGADPQWYVGSDPLSGVQVLGKNYSESAAGSSLDITLKNQSPLPVGNIVVYAILKDADSNVLDFSKTIVDQIAPQGTAVAPFTWPASHSGKVISIEALAVPE